MKMLLALLVAAFASAAMGARILAVLPLTAKSHHIMFNAILRTLAEGGHEVLCLSGLPADKEIANLTVKHLTTSETIEKGMTKEILDSLMNMSPVAATSMVWRKAQIFFGRLNEEKDLMRLINSNEKFDLILLEVFYAQEPLIALGHKFKAPIINLQPFGAFSLVSRSHGNSLNLAYIPDFSFQFSDRMSFYQRAINTYSILSVLFQYYVYILPEQDQFMRELFQDDSLPPLSEMMQNNIALTFSNAHPYVHYAQPYTSNIQPIGGIHITEERRPLPSDLKTFLDESPEGVIYFSVGTFIPDHILDDEYFNNFLAVFRQLPQKVLWKTTRNLKNLPNNVKTIKWAPQQDILAHPNVRVFMTHGGLLSQHEVIYAGVPVICTPYFGDQPMNAKFYEEKGIGVILPFKTLSEETILSALTTVLGDPKYKDNMARMSRIYRDRPISPADTLLYWVEYVIRHGGAPHLRPASATMPFYQLYLLDVIGILLALLFLISLLLYLVLKLIFNIIFKINRHLKHVKSKKDN